MMGGETARRNIARNNRRRFCRAAQYAGATMAEPFTKATAQALLAPHIDGIGECLHAAVDRFNTARPVLGLAVSARSQASLISDYAADHAGVVFAEDPKVRVVYCQELPVLNCSDLVCIRFKKLAAGWSFSRNDTLQTKRWETQRPLLGMEAAANLAAAYRLDDTGRAIEVAALVYSVDRRYQWHIEIPPPGRVLELPNTLFDDPMGGATVRSEMGEKQRDSDEG